MDEQKNNDKTEIKYQKLSVLAIASFILSIIAIVGGYLLFIDEGLGGGPFPLHIFGIVIYSGTLGCNILPFLILASIIFAAIALFKQNDEKRSGIEINQVTNSLAILSLVFISLASCASVMSILSAFAY